MAATNVHDLADRLAAIRQEIRDEYTQDHAKPWIVGFSGGKDSTLLLHLVIEALFELPPSRRTRPIHVLSNDTLVESPVVQAFVDATLERLREAVEALRLPIAVVKTTPDRDGTFWVNLIGKGYPAPTRLFRWCTDRMKIRPTTTYIREQVDKAGEVILLLGVRRSESSARAKVMKRYDNGTRLNPHNDLAGCHVFRPIVELSTDDVWLALTNRRPPWGGTHQGLVTLYQNAQAGECPLVMDKETAPSCGTSSARFGCWTCTVVEKDNSLEGLIDNGDEHLEPLRDFRTWLRAFSKDFKNRMAIRRDGRQAVERKDGTRAVPEGEDGGFGPFTIRARLLILEELLRTQRETDLLLITEAEIARVKEIWREDESRAVLRKADQILKWMEPSDDVDATVVQRGGGAKGVEVGVPQTQGAHPAPAGPSRCGESLRG